MTNFCSFRLKAHAAVGRKNRTNNLNWTLSIIKCHSTRRKRRAGLQGTFDRCSSCGTQLGRTTFIAECAARDVVFVICVHTQVTHSLHKHRESFVSINLFTRCTGHSEYPARANWSTSTTGGHCKGFVKHDFYLHVHGTLSRSTHRSAWMLAWIVAGQTVSPCWMNSLSSKKQS